MRYEQETVLCHRRLGIVMLVETVSVLFFMMRESGSVKLYWSLSRGPDVGGLGAGPRGGRWV